MAVWAPGTYGRSVGWILMSVYTIRLGCGIFDAYYLGPALHVKRDGERGMGSRGVVK